MLYTAPNDTMTNEAVLERQERRRNEEFCSCFCFFVLFCSGLILFFSFFFGGAVDMMGGYGGDHEVSRIRVYNVKFPKNQSRIYT